MELPFIVGVILLVTQLPSSKATEHELVFPDSEDLDAEVIAPPLDEFHIYDPKMTQEEVKDDELHSLKKRSPKAPGANIDRADRIVNNIKSHQFDKALKKIQRLTNRDELQSTMYKVIHNVYRNDEANLGLLLQLVASNDHVTSNLAIFEALKYEQRNNDRTSYVAKLKVLKSFLEKIANGNSLPADDADQADTLNRELNDSATETTADELKKAIRDSDSVSMTAILENVSKHHPILFKQAIFNAVNNAFDSNELAFLFPFFKNHENTSQSVYAYRAIQYALKKNNRLYQFRIIVNLAFDLKKALNKGVHERDAVNAANDIKLALPKSIYNVAFETKPLCIVNSNYRNYGDGEHLFAAGKVYDSSRRYLYTWTDGTGVTNGQWYFERNDDETFHIKNSYYVKKDRSHRVEYLFAENFYHGGDAERYAFTRIDGKPDGEEFNWLVIPNLDDTVGIKNTKYNEFLYASKDKEGDHRRYVYTKSKVDWGTFWRIEVCKTNFQH